MARRRHSNRRRRRGNFGFLYKLLSVLVICAAVVMALTLFFRVDTIEVTGTERYTEKDKLLSARMYKAITMILFKLEGQKILRNPDFGMADRLLLDKIDYESRTVTVDGRAYPMLDTDFPTVNPADPYALTPEEEILIHQLTLSFLHSEKLQRHVRFLYSKGSLYKIFNGNLLFHGCIPMAADGSLLSFPVNGGRL